MTHLWYFSTVKIILIILCRRFGASLGNTYGSGTGPIWLDDLQCSGSETSLDNCTHGGWGVHNCGHGEDVSIRCDNGTCIFEHLNFAR